MIETEWSGLRLIDLMAGYDRVIVIDAAKTGERPLGEVTAADPMQARASRADPHRMGLSQAIATAKALGVSLPIIELLTVEVADPFTLAEGLSPELEERMDEIVHRIREMLMEGPNATEGSIRPA